MATVWVTGAAAFVTAAAGLLAAGEAGAEDAVGVAALPPRHGGRPGQLLSWQAPPEPATRGPRRSVPPEPRRRGAEAAGVAVTLATGWVTGAAAFVTGAVAVETALPRSSPEAALALPSPTSRIVSSSKAKTASSPALLVVLLNTPAKPIRSPLPPARTDQTSSDLKTGRYPSTRPKPSETPSVAIYTVAFWWAKQDSALLVAVAERSPASNSSKRSRRRPPEVLTEAEAVALIRACSPRAATGAP